MKGLLNNPKVVAVLALAAFGVAGQNILAPIISSPVQENLVDVPAPGLESTQFTPASVESDIEHQQTGSPREAHPLSHQEIPYIGWALNATRDPFTPFDSNIVMSTETQPEAEIEVEQAEQGPSPEHDFTLGAIAIGSTFKLALIDNEVVRSGNMVADIQVTTVKARALELRDKSGDARKVVFDSAELRRAD